MLHQAAIAHGVRLRFLADRADDAAVQMAPQWEIGSAMSAADLRRFATMCDVVTFEHEVVDLEGLAVLEAEGTILRPSPAALRAVADKLTMRAAAAAAGLPVPPWRSVTSAAELDAALDEWPDAVLKLSRGGYDGRGVFIPTDVSGGRSLGRTLLDEGHALLVEPRLDFSAEAAVIVARRPGGAHVTYDPVRTCQVDGQCRLVAAPSELGGELDGTARALAARAAESLDVVGLLAVELFVVEGRLVVNELAVRPHNTGHHTIDACITSQFENHVRAVLDLPLGDPSLNCPAATMVNVIGNSAGDDPLDHLAEGLGADAGARIHLYGKQVRPNRKVGHVTVCGTDEADVTARAWAVVAALHGDIPEEVR
jgi:5-(carboxyamino)imidazole ribonucleotide synthase